LNSPAPVLITAVFEVLLLQQHLPPAFLNFSCSSSRWTSSSRGSLQPGGDRDRAQERL